MPDGFKVRSVPELAGEKTAEPAQKMERRGKRNGGVAESQKKKSAVRIFREPPEQLPLKQALALVEGLARLQPLQPHRTDRHDDCLQFLVRGCSLTMFIDHVHSSTQPSSLHIRQKTLSPIQTQGVHISWIRPRTQLLSLCQPLLEPRTFFLRAVVSTVAADRHVRTAGSEAVMHAVVCFFLVFALRALSILVTFAMLSILHFTNPPRSTVRDPKSAFRNLLIHPVVRRFLGDHHVVHMRLAEAGARDLDELRPFPERLEALAAAVAHARLHAADELVHARGKRPLVRHAAFDALGHELGPSPPRGTGSSGPCCPAPWRRWSPCRGRPCSCGPDTGWSRPGFPRCRRRGCRS